MRHRRPPRSTSTASATAPPAAAEGTRLYRAGRFTEAGRAYRAALDADPDHLEALVGAGAVALLHNQLDDAEAWLGRAVERSPGHVRALQDLAEAAYRRDDFPAAAAWVRRLAGVVSGRQRQELEVRARKLEAFKDRTPYRVDSGPRDVRVPFVVTDPLPVVEVTLGDGVTVPFFIDTGGHEVFVDQALARDLGLPDYGTTTTGAAGGKEGPQGNGRLDALTLGGLSVHDVPVLTLDFAALGFTEALGGIPVKGVIGTAFLYHFLATIDYPGGALALRPRTPDRLRSFEQEATRAGQHEVPFWLSGTNLVLVQGTVNDSDPMLLFADTGGTGTALYPTNATIERAGIALDHDRATEGVGAAGTVKVVPFVVDKLSLGAVTGRDLPGFATPGDDPDRTFRTDGLVGREFAVGGFVSHQFFRPYALTFDFDGMRLFLGAPE